MAKKNAVSPKAARLLRKVAAHIPEEPKRGSKLQTLQRVTARIGSSRPGGKVVKKEPRPIDFEIAKAKTLWFAEAKKRRWDTDIRDWGWQAMKGALIAGRMRRAKVKKHDDERTLLKGV